MASRDVKRLTKALRGAHATRLQARFAAIILGHNGIGEGLEYVAGIKRRNEDRQQPRLFDALQDLEMVIEEVGDAQS